MNKKKIVVACSKGCININHVHKQCLKKQRATLKVYFKHVSPD